MKNIFKKINTTNKDFFNSVKEILYYEEHHLLRFVFALLAIFFVGVSGFFFYSKFLQASPFAFTQSSWVGGVTTNSATHPLNQAGWTEYNQEANVTTSTDVKLTSVDKTFTDDGTAIMTGTIAPSGGGFASGTNSSTVIFDSGTLAKVKLALEPSIKTDYPGYAISGSLAFDNANSLVWVGDGLSGAISKFDVNTGTRTDYFPILAAADIIAFDSAQSSLWVVSTTAHQLSKVDFSGVTTGTFDTVGISPLGVGVATSSVWVTNAGSNNITKFDSTTGAVIGTYSVGGTPYGVVFDNVTNSIWTANQIGTVSKVDVDTGASTDYPVGSGPHSLTFDNVTNSIWVANSGSDTVSKVNINTGSKIDYAVGSYPDSITFDSVTNSVWVANLNSQTVSKVNINTGDRIDYAIGATPGAVTFDSVTNSVWATHNSDSSVSKISTASPVYATPGIFESAVIDFGEVTTFTTFAYSKNTPSNTTVTVDVRAGNVAVPDGTWTAWTTSVANGADISAFSGNQYIQYRVNFATTDTVVSATLDDVSISSNYWTFVDDGSSYTLGGGIIPSGGGFANGLFSNTVISGSGTGTSVGLTSSVSRTDYPVLPQSDYKIIFDGVDSVWTHDFSQNVSKINVTTPATITNYLIANPECGTNDFTFVSTLNAIWRQSDCSNYAETIDITTGVSTNITTLSAPIKKAVFYDSYTDFIWTISKTTDEVYKIDTAGTTQAGPYAVGANPTSIAFSPGFVWVTNNTDGTITKLDDAGTVIDTYTVGAGPSGIAYDTFDSVWVVNNLDGTVNKINVTTGAVSGPYIVGVGPINITFSDAFDNSMWVTNNTDSTISKINIDTGVVDGPYAVETNPVGIAFDGITNSIWTTNGFNGTDYTVSKMGVTPTYAPSGTFASQNLGGDAVGMIDLGSFVTFSTFSWDGFAPAEITDITMEVQGSTDLNTWSGWSAVTNGGDISALSGDRYIQYRATLTSDTTVNVFLNSVTINYSQYQSSGTLTSSVFDSSSATNTITKLAWASTGITASELVEFQIRSSSDGLTWSNWCGPTLCDDTSYFLDADNNVALIAGHPLLVGNNDRYFQYRATLFSGGYLTPTLTSVTTSYDTGSVVDPPVISNVASSVITSSGATITWDTDTASDSYVNYSTSPSLASPTNAGNGTLVTSPHTVVLTGLTASTPYYFEVLSTDATSQLTTDTNSGTYYTFTTSANAPSGGGGSFAVGPTSLSGAATSVTNVSAVLNGTVNSNGITGTTRWFEWGTSALGLSNQTTHMPHTDIPSGTTATLSWSGITGATVCKINGGQYVNKVVSCAGGSLITDTLTTNTTYILTASNGFGPEATKSLSIVVP